MALDVAKKYKQVLIEKSIPVIDVMIFGSLAKGNNTQASDIDIAVIHKPFSGDRMKDRKTIRRLRNEKRYPIDILCFYPEDLDNKYYGLAQEVKRYGIAV